VVSLQIFQLGQKSLKAEVDVKASLEMFEQIDYVAYGTFSSLGEGQFQLTFHLSGNKNGVARSFIAKGTLTEALDKLAKQVFDFFQKNVYPDWETPHTQLSWLPIPINPTKLKVTLGKNQTHIANYVDTDFHSLVNC